MITQEATRKQLKIRLQPKLDEAEALLKAVVRERTVKPQSSILNQGDVPTTAHVLLEGHTYRYRLLADGRRQITAVLVPGDVCDLEAVMRGRADYSVNALTHCVLGEIPAGRVTDPTTLDPEMIRAVWRRLLRDEAISREWLVNMGRRHALEKVAHLLCEFQVRLEAIGLAPADKFDMSFTQAELADILGMSTVHINRTLQKLRKAELIELSGGKLSILNRPVLEMVAGFDPTYLQIN